MMYELPPQVQGSSDVLALRDYLVRLAQSLDQVSGDSVVVAANKAVAKANTDTVKQIQSEASALKSLIVKNANEIYQYADEKFEEYDSLYVAKSDFGDYYEQIESKVQTTARGTLENYEYQAGVTLLQEVNGLNSYMNTLNGQIRRGVIEDPSTNEMHIGIAISESLTFNGTWTDSNTGITYDKLADNSTLGLYTASGWQFWIGGRKMGWFSSQDSMLHVANIVVESTLQVSDDWQFIKTPCGFGLRYIGEVV